MAKKDRYADLENQGRSEYGGGEVPQRYPDGTERDLGMIPGAVGEQAMLMRIAGINDFDPDPASDITIAELSGVELSRMSAAQRQAYENDMVIARERARRRAEVMEKTNDYAGNPAQYVGEPVTDPAADTGIKASIERNADA